MPVTDLSGGDDDWLQQYLAGHQAGQAFGASQPYGASGYPDNLPNRPYGPPGSAQVGWPGASPGAPSMGYPAMGQPTAQQPPAAAPGPAQGLSLTNNPISNWFRNNVSIGAPNLANAVNPAFWHDAAAARQNLGNVLNAASQGQPTNSADLVGAGDTSLRAGLLPQARGVAVPSSPASTTTADPSGRVAPWFTSSNNPMPYQPSSLAKSDPNAPPGRRSYVGQPPGAGAPSGNPSQTPTPPRGSSSARFGTVQYQVPGSGVGPLSRSPIYTALNLFGRG